MAVIFATEQLFAERLLFNIHIYLDLSEYCERNFPITDSITKKPQKISHINTAAYVVWYLGICDFLVYIEA